MKVKLEPLTSDDREQFIKDNQEAFNYMSGHDSFALYVTSVEYE